MFWQLVLLVLKAALQALLANLPALLFGVAGSFVLQSQQPQLCRSVCSSGLGVNAALWLAMAGGLFMLMQKLNPNGSAWAMGISLLKRAKKAIKTAWDSIPE